MHVATSAVALKHVSTINPYLPYKHLISRAAILGIPGSLLLINNSVMTIQFSAAIACYIAYIAEYLASFLSYMVKSSTNSSSMCLECSLGSYIDISDVVAMVIASTS